MGKVSRREFFEEMIATKADQATTVAGNDPIYEKYANKELPRGLSKTTGSLNEYTGQWTDKEIIHLLRRTMFGVKYEDVVALRTKTMVQAVDELLSAQTTPAPPVNNYNTSSYFDPTGVALDDTWVTAPYGDSTVNSFRRLSMTNWWIGRMIYQPERRITEKMTFFWHNHFATEYTVVAYAHMMYNHHMILRNNALGNFKTLVTAITKDPAMLRYLNGYLNTKTAPDENYARELFELFTLGKNYTPIYTEDDIKASAKILTGWRYKTTDWSSYFSSTLHETSDKQFSSFFNNKVITGKTGSAGAQETDELIDMIFSKFEVAKFIVRKLYRFFVYYDIDQTTESTVILPLASLMMSTGWEIKPVLNKLLKSEHFFDVLSRDCFIRTPIDYVVGTFRTFDIQLPSGWRSDNEYKVYNYLRSYMSQLGLEPNLPPNVAGWPAFYQEPDYYEKWINSTTMPRRMQFMDMMLNSGFSAGTGTAIKIDPMWLAKKFYSPADPNLLIDFYTDLLLGLGLSKTLKDTYKISTLLTGQTQDYYWSNAWATYISNPNTTNTNIVKTRLVSLLTELTHLAEHNLC
ncbi:MAG: DUF1800 domain-containing protein [Chitinophagaceae bacterium]|nr:DUF1800 domain-containing protein [Chitinophagaceae bacterium]MCB9044557.1 DUF1800 domain-containing protein [Chitinophagales bacterium]